MKWIGNVTYMKDKICLRFSQIWKLDVIWESNMEQTTVWVYALNLIGSREDQVMSFVNSMMYIFMKMSPKLQMQYSKSLKYFSNNIGAESNLEIVSYVAMTQKVWKRSNIFNTKILNCGNILDITRRNLL